ncbi:hypothetical protein Sm713_39110 [Streptomyces sp. TS71-3]|nr:hypothetical protein Sm713_39110 [Streptomyces sp. TS71-3]
MVAADRSGAARAVEAPAPAAVATTTAVATSGMSSFRVRIGVAFPSAFSWGVDRTAQGPMGQPGPVRRRCSCICTLGAFVNSLVVTVRLLHVRVKVWTWSGGRGRAILRFRE